MLGLKLNQVSKRGHRWWYITAYPKKYAHGFCFAVLCCGYTLTDFPISIRLTSLALWQSNDCPSASKATLMNMDKYFMWIHYERLHNHNKAKHNKTVCIFLGIYFTSQKICTRALLSITVCVVRYWPMYPYPSGSFYWHWGKPQWGNPGRYGSRNPLKLIVQPQQNKTQKVHILWTCRAISNSRFICPSVRSHRTENSPYSNYSSMS